MPHPSWSLRQPRRGSPGRRGPGVLAAATLVILAGGPLASGGELKGVLRGGADAARWPGLEDLTAAGAAWDGPGVMTHVAGGDGPGWYELGAPAAVVMSRDPRELKPNRRYRLSAAVRTTFDRPAEVNAGVRLSNATTKRPVLFHFAALPARTDGWVRWDYEFDADPRCGPDVEARFWMAPYGLDAGGTVEIADLTLTELPPVPLVPRPRGTGVTFRGGPGDLPMRVGGAAAGADGALRVTVTGAEFAFHPDAGRIEAFQRVGGRRAVAEVSAGGPLTGLRVLSSTPTACVLTCDRFTVGVQCDGLAVFSPHREEELTVRSRIGGRWNRLRAGHLLAADGRGGFAVNPHVPAGTGRIARVRVTDPAPDFVDIPTGEFGNTTFLSDADPGWAMTWAVGPGERLGVSVFPPRPFDRAGLRRANWGLAYRGTPTSAYRRAAPHLRAAVLWDFIPRGYGLSWDGDFQPADPAEFRRHVAALRAAGMDAAPYVSAYFFHNRDPAEYVAVVRRLAEEYGVTGVYSDGVPSSEWLVAYEEVRMLREALPGGTIILHTTGQAMNGGPPLGAPDLLIPAVDTYATVTYRGEWVPHEGDGWAYARFVTPQVGLANCFGMMKGDRWAGPDRLRQDLLHLRRLGAARRWEHVANPPPGYVERYAPILNRLADAAEAHAGEEDVIRRVLRPLAVELTAPLLGTVVPQESTPPPPGR